MTLAEREFVKRRLHEDTDGLSTAFKKKFILQSAIDWKTWAFRYVNFCEYLSSVTIFQFYVYRIPHACLLLLALLTDPRGELGLCRSYCSATFSSAIVRRCLLPSGI